MRTVPVRPAQLAPLAPHPRPRQHDGTRLLARCRRIRKSARVGRATQSAASARSLAAGL